MTHYLPSQEVPRTSCEPNNSYHFVALREMTPTKLEKQCLVSGIQCKKWIGTAAGKRRVLQRYTWIQFVWCFFNPSHGESSPSGRNLSWTYFPTIFLWAAIYVSYISTDVSRINQRILKNAWCFSSSCFIRKPKEILESFAEFLRKEISIKNTTYLKVTVHGRKKCTQKRRVQFFAIGRGHYGGIYFEKLLQVYISSRP